MKNNFLNKTESYFNEHNAKHTAKEINQQPEMWRKIAVQLRENKVAIDAFMTKVLAVDNLSVVFTGAGSSAFVGEVLEYIIKEECNIECKTIHTTDIVSAPDAVLYDKPTLLISFARSGESPESVAAVRFATKRIKNCYNLIVVCDGTSSLAKLGNELENTMVVALPKETCDQGFAMTSSVSSMALATWGIFHYQQLNLYADKIELLADEVEKSMEECAKKAEEIALNSYRRLIWLGSGPLQGLAREGAVKSMELSDGYIHASYDGAAAFRHGPKTVINDETLTIHFITNHEHTRKYDVDLNNEINAEKEKNKVITVGEKGLNSLIKNSDYYVEYLNENKLLEDTQMIAYIHGLVFAQLLSMFKSIQLGYTTDNPCLKGDVNRVVKGIVIYDIV